LAFRSHALAWQGWWLNLPQATGRAAFMQDQLDSLGLAPHYQRFPAFAGEPDHAVARGLQPGEEGAWRSWIALLKQAAASDAELVHLVEDDVEITPQLTSLLGWPELAALLDANHLVCTDAYLGPNQARQALEALRQNGGWIAITEGFVSPCICSLLARPAQLPPVIAALERRWQAPGTVPPIDLALGELAHGGQLRFTTTAPFVTGPAMEQARSSFIRPVGDASFERSREAMTLLRRLMLAQSDRASLAFDWLPFWQSLELETQQDALLDAFVGWIDRGSVRPY